MSAPYDPNQGYYPQQGGYPPQGYPPPGQGYPPPQPMQYQQAPPPQEEKSHGCFYTLSWLDCEFPLSLVERVPYIMWDGLADGAEEEYCDAL
ncbi:hypothetical protein ACHAPO_007343 [Fusarium lateritium]